MSTISSYPTRTFKESQKFLVLDPDTQSTSLVFGRDLVEYITPQSTYVFAEQSRAVAQNEDYQIGALIQTAGDLTAGDNFAGTFLVVPGGGGDFPMANGNDLLIIKGDILLREQLASNAPGSGSDLIAHTGTSDTVTQALDKRTIFVGSVAELSSLTPGAAGQQSSVSGDSPAMYEWALGDFTSSVDGFEIVAWSGDSSPGATGAWLLFDRTVTKQYSSQYLQTTSDILNNVPVELMRFIPKSLHSAIKDYTSNTDISAYFQAANDALTSIGGTILLPRGRLGFSNGVQPTNRVNFKGQGRCSQIVALPDIISDTMFVFANGTSSMFSSRLDDCWIRVEGVAAVKQAIVADAWQENCGSKGLVISGLDGADKRGILIRNGYGGAAYLRLEDIEIFGDNMVAGIDVEQISSVGGFVLDIKGATIAGGAGAPVGSAVRMANDTLMCDGLHVEYATNGLYLDGGSRASVRCMTGSANEVTNLVTLSAAWTGGLNAQMLIPNGATTTILDNVTGADKTGIISDFNYDGATSPSNAKAWVVFDGTTGGIKSSHGVSSVTKTATGDYTVTWSGSLGPDYAAFVEHNATNQRSALHTEVSKTSTAFRFRTREWTGVSSADAVTIDPTDVRVVAYASR